MRTTAMLIMAAALAVAAAAQPRAQGPMACGQRANVIETLQKKFGEARRAIGFDGRGGVTEIWVSDGTGTFTVLLTSPSGVTCLMSSGTRFETIAPETPSERS